MSSRVMLDYLLYLAVASAAWCFRQLPLRAALAIGARLGDVAWRLIPSRQEITVANIQGAFNGAISQGEVIQLARAAYRNTGRSVVEFCRFPRLTTAAMAHLVDVEGVEHLTRAFAAGRGVLMLTAHLGNWELAGQAIVSLGYPLNGIYRPLSNRFLSGLVNRYRRFQGAKPIADQGSLGAVLQALRRREGVAVLLDQNAAPTEGVFVDFLGRPACVHKSLAVVASKTRAPVIPLFLIRLADGRHRLVVEPAVPLERTDDPQRDIAVNTERFTRIIETYVRRYPDQWFWMHRRWKTQPSPEPAPILHPASPGAIS